MIVLALVLLTGAQCSSTENATKTGPRNDLATMETAILTINNHTFQTWLAKTDSEREHGLMQVTADQMAKTPDGAERGMLFLFGREQILQFWMKDTVIPLDIAFIRNDGRIVQIHTMAPLETRLYSSVMPASMALEVRAGLLHELGVVTGDLVQIPESVLKR